MSDMKIDTYLSKIHQQRPQIHSITNSVVQNLTANQLLAIGCIPSMTTNIVEIEDFLSTSSALLINLGMLEGDRKTSILKAIEVANSNNIPWILDPVMVHRSQDRLLFAKEILTYQPTAIRGNASEITSLKSVSNDVNKSKTIWITTGAIDLVEVDGRRQEISCGHELMTYVTGMGCAGTAIVAAFLCVAEDPFEASIAALSFLGKTGETAAKTSPAPGHFEKAFLDELYLTSQRAFNKEHANA